MTVAPTRHETACPALHHFGLTTAHLEPMVGWYSRVLGLSPTHQSRAPAGARTAPGARAAWLGNDDAHHRVAVVGLRGLADDPLRSRHKGFQHIAFEHPSLDDLLAAATTGRSRGVGSGWNTASTGCAAIKR